MSQKSIFNGNSNLAIFTAVLFISVALSGFWTTGCDTKEASGDEVVEALCKKLESCSKLGEWNYDSYGECTKQELESWNEYDECHTEMEDLANCAADLKCDQLTLDHLIVLCKDEGRALGVCMEKADEEDQEDADGDDQESPEDDTNNPEDTPENGFSDEDLADAFCGKIDSCSEFELWEYTSKSDCYQSIMYDFEDVGPCRPEFVDVLTCAEEVVCEVLSLDELDNYCYNVMQSFEDCLIDAGLVE
ncbi:MAG TPA: hypothetical protein PLC97_00590 [Myxococcota bacterium]|nr:hypothetical protein [Myxococcota bacterium]